MVTAAGLWIPGQKSIFLPPEKFLVSHRVEDGEGWSLLWRDNTLMEMHHPDGSVDFHDTPHQAQSYHAEGTVTKIWWTDRAPFPGELRST